MLYNRFSDFLRERYGAKVYKLPVNLPVTCPNRDGRLGRGGCIFCGEEGAGFETLPDKLRVGEQIIKNRDYIGKKYGAEKFIAYFQNYSNTYLPLENFLSYMAEACVEGVAALYISTRPDCISREYMGTLRDIGRKKGVDIVVELGLQTVNYHTLKLLNRGHGLAEFIDAVMILKSFGIGTCAHYIMDLPMDGIEDVVEGARILSALGVNQVKCHSLYILKNTVLGLAYEKGEITPLSFEQYLERIIAFLEYLDPGIVIQRLIGRAPEERSLFCSWGMSWWKVRDRIEEAMAARGSFQGRKFSYLNGCRCIGGLNR